MTRHCPKCGRDLDESEFYHNRTRRDGLDAYCKACRKKSNEKYIDRMLDYRFERMMSDPDYAAQYREYYQKWYERNKDKMRAYQQEYRKKNFERIKEYKQHYERTHKTDKTESL